MRIVVRALDAKAARAAQARLADAGVEALALAGPYRAAPAGEDILIALAGAEEVAASALDSEAPPLACLFGSHASLPPTGGCAAPFLGAIALDAAALLLRAQVKAWTRVAAAIEERARRAATAAARGVPTPRPYAPRAMKTLYVGAPSAIFLSLERALAREGGVVTAAFSSYAGFDHLHDDVFDAVILNGAQDTQTALSLCAALRRNSALFDLPTMMITACGDAVAATAAIERGACAIIEANADCDGGVGWLLEAVRRERLRRTAEHELRALRDLMGDARTGLWRSEAFSDHLDRLALDHRRSGRRLGLAVMRVMPAHGASTPDPVSWARAFADIASLAGRLARETDCAAALGGDLLVVALPAADLSAARRACERIASVAECTAFAPGDDAPLSIEQSAVDLQPGEGGRALLARALRAIDVESAAG